MLGACSPVSMPIGSSDIETPLVLTGSIPSLDDDAYTDVGADDRKLIAKTIHTAVDDDNTAEALAWSNPESGNSGTISDVDVSQFEDTGCLSFKTTANTITGVGLYEGTACRDISNAMAITVLRVAKT
ncbi:RT0821/Lpp0805 family surface protein [uncultured Roseibium sp.]|uniref:RT0821/Lpp0805 family surface protein n=1 Tax=uncultured Roseibium sp. TaxID=1936171 RepID=UPI0032171BEC